MQPQVLALILGGLALLILVFAIVSSRRSGQDIEERLERFTLSEIEERKAIEAAARRPSPIAEGLNRALAGRSFAEDLSAQLARADVKLTVGEFLAVQVILIAVGGGLGFVLSGGNIVFVLLLAVAGFFAPRIYLGTAQARRLKAFNNQLSDMLNLLVNGLRSGYSVTQAMEAVARELPPPLSTEIGRVVQEMQIGLSMDQTLANMLRRVRSDDLDLIVTAMNVQREVGGNLAEILDTISHTIRERVRIKGEVAVLTAQGRISMYVLVGLPIAIVLFLYLINPTYIGRLWSGQGTAAVCGWLMIVCSVLSVTAGYFAIRKIVSIEV